MPASSRFHRALTPLCAAGLFLVNAYVCGGLFSREFTERMESIESSYISISRWAMEHWNDLSWFPLWFNGMPFRRVYQPGLHLSVAALASAAGWTPQHAYHFLTALAYCLGPVTLFWLCWRSTGRRGYAFVAGLLYSLVSPVCFVLSGVRNDVGGLLLARRYQVLVHYGEGPHTTALMMLPLVIWLVDRAIFSQRRRLYFPFAALALAALALTNWPGTVGFSMALAAWCLARLNTGRPLHWPTLAAVGVAAYLVASPWLPPSIIRAVLRNAQQSDATMFGAAQLLPLAILAVLLAGLHLLFHRLKAGTWLRFFVYFALISGAVSIACYWFGWKLLPQPNRFQPEFDMAASGALAYGLAAAWGKLRRPLQVAALCLLVIFCVSQARRYHRYARNLTRPIDITTTIEYRMAKWFDAHMNGHRVFAPGNVSLWMNLFTDTPQMIGCCEQGVPNHEYRIAAYVIYTGQNAGERDAEISLIWLRAYGADAIGITGPHSTEYFKPFWNARKFDGVLPELWRDGDNVVYRVPRRSASLAHVIDRSSVVAHAPENGLVVEPLQPLVANLEDPRIPSAGFRWLNVHEAEIDAQLAAGQVVFLQVAYDPGWRAFENGAERPITPDAIGMMAVDPGHSGPCRLRLLYMGTGELVIARAAQVFGILVLLAWPLAPLLRNPRATRAGESTKA